MAKMIDEAELALLARAVRKLGEGSAHLPEYDAGFDLAGAAEVLDEVAGRMHDNYPYFHPQYAGQMLKPPHPVARIAYALSLWINPNNHALDGGRASSAMEKECIVDIGKMFGWSPCLGHLTGGGTMANLEALWVAGKLHPNKGVLASEFAHYTHKRLTDVLRIPFVEIGADSAGRMDCSALEKELGKGTVGTVVATVGTTGQGAIDPLGEILELQEDYGFRVHVDAAYGGYFGLASHLKPQARASFDRLSAVDSIVVDPHKHGLQPYGCGCVLFRDPSVGSIYRHESPYTYFSSKELHLGEISLECSRPGASAVALWATMRLLPLEPGGQFAASLDRCLDAARDLYRRLERSDFFVPLYEPELDIVVYACKAKDTILSSESARRLFEIAAERELHLALSELPTRCLQGKLGSMQIDSDSLTCLRSVLMKPEQTDWSQRIFELLEESARRL